LSYFPHAATKYRVASGKKENLSIKLSTVAAAGGHFSGWKTTGGRNTKCTATNFRHFQKTRKIIQLLVILKLIDEKDTRRQKKI